MNCPICSGKCPLLDVVDFHKTCVDPTGAFKTLSGIPVYYAMCEGCGFCFAPALAAWPLEEFEQKIYNEQYTLVDPEHGAVAGHELAANLQATFTALPAGFRHLDYGGGNGLLSQVLRDTGWNSTSYDPFLDKDARSEALGQFDLITAFEVFEHVPDVQQLVTSLRALMKPDGVVLFSTLLSDGNIRRGERLSWWYASPRNGHISLFSRMSLGLLASRHKLNFRSNSPGLHVLYDRLPDWARPILPAAAPAA